MWQNADHKVTHDVAEVFAINDSQHILTDQKTSFEMADNISKNLLVFWNLRVPCIYA